MSFLSILGLSNATENASLHTFGVFIQVCLLPTGWLLEGSGPILLLSGKDARMIQAPSSHWLCPRPEPPWAAGPPGSPGLSAQGLDFALFDELAAPQLLDLPVQVADLRHGPPPAPGAGQSRGRRPLRTAQGSPEEREDESVDQSVRRGSGGVGVGRQLNSGAGPAPPTPTPASPHIGPGTPSVPRPWPLPANCRRTPRSRARDGGLEGSQPITAAATPAPAPGLPACLPPSLRFGPPPPPLLLPAPPRKQREISSAARRMWRHTHLPPRAPRPYPHLPEQRSGDEPKEADVGSVRAEVTGGPVDPPLAS